MHAYIYFYVDLMQVEHVITIIIIIIISNWFFDLLACCWGNRYVLCDICWMRSRSGEQNVRISVFSRDLHNMGIDRYGHGLLCWSHLRRSLQPSCHYLIRRPQTIPSETGIF